MVRSDTRHFLFLCPRKGAHSPKAPLSRANIIIIKRKPLLEKLKSLDNLKNLDNLKSLDNLALKKKTQFSFCSSLA